MSRVWAWLQGLSWLHIGEQVLAIVIGAVVLFLLSLWTVLPQWLDLLLKNVSPLLVQEVLQVQFLFTPANIVVSLLVLALLTYFVRRSMTPPHTRRVRKVVYFDAEYPTSYVTKPEGVRDFFMRRGFRALNARQLGAWMKGRIERGDAPFSLVVFAQDIVPDTVAEVPNETCLARRYLDAGGRIAWQGDTPFFYQGKPEMVRAEWNQQGCIGVLGVRPHAWAKWQGTTQLTRLTADGQKWGLSGLDRLDRPVEPTDVTTVFTENPEHVYAFSWHKNFNLKYPHSGFVRFWPGKRHAPATDVDEDFFRLATAFSPFVCCER